MRTLFSVEQRKVFHHFERRWHISWPLRENATFFTGMWSKSARCCCGVFVRGYTFYLAGGKLKLLRYVTSGFWVLVQNSRPILISFNVESCLINLHILWDFWQLHICIHKNQIVAKGKHGSLLSRDRNRSRKQNLLHISVYSCCICIN